MVMRWAARPSCRSLHGVGLMIERGVGVREYRKVEFKRLDEDFFGEE